MSRDDTSGDGAEGARILLAKAHRSVDAAAEHDPALAELAGRLRELSLLTDDVAADLAAYAATVDADPVRLAVVEERRSVLRDLVRRYLEQPPVGVGSTPSAERADVDALLQWADAASLEVDDLDDDARLDRLRDEHAGLVAELESAAGSLTRGRTEAAERLGREVSAELADLAMAAARFAVAVRPSGGPGPSGCDEVEFVLSAHEGAPEVPVHKGASGGELSRVMLALEVVLAGADPVATFVFDEVDAGVGGRAAVEVGRRLARLAESTQVLVVTHLPQVAAFADQHVVVSKSSDGTVTSSDVSGVEGEDRVRELARMLAGLDDSDVGRAHAVELLETAGRLRAAPR